MKFIFIVCGAIFVVLLPDVSSEDMFLGALRGLNDSKSSAEEPKKNDTSKLLLEGKKGGPKEAKKEAKNPVSNRNGIREHFETSSSYGQKDGKCFKRIVEVRNGVRKEREITIDCEKAKAEILANSEKAQREIEEQARKMREEHEKMMASIWGPGEMKMPKMPKIPKMPKMLKMPNMPNMPDMPDMQRMSNMQRIPDMRRIPVSNRNGIEDHFETSSTIGQKDGKCVKRTVEIRNGVRKEMETFIDCEKTKADIQMNSVKAQRDIEEHSRKMKEVHDRIMASHWDGMKKMGEGPKNPFEMLLQPDDSSGGNIILGTIDGSSNGHFDGSQSQSHYTNNNGVEERYEAHTTYEQRPDGSCIKKVVEVRNGREEVREYPMDCARARAEIQGNSARTQQHIREHSRRMSDEHERLMRDHMQATLQMEEEIRSRMRRHFSRF